MATTTDKLVRGKQSTDRKRAAAFKRGSRVWAVCSSCPACGGVCRSVEIAGVFQRYERDSRGRLVCVVLLNPATGPRRYVTVARRNIRGRSDAEVAQGFRKCVQGVPQ